MHFLFDFNSILSIAFLREEVVSADLGDCLKLSKELCHVGLGNDS